MQPIQMTMMVTMQSIFADIKVISNVYGRGSGPHGIPNSEHEVRIMIYLTILTLISGF